MSTLLNVLYIIHFIILLYAYILDLRITPVNTKANDLEKSVHEYECSFEVKYFQQNLIKHNVSEFSWSSHLSVFCCCNKTHKAEYFIKKRDLSGSQWWLKGPMIMAVL